MAKRYKKFYSKKYQKSYSKKSTTQRQELYREVKKQVIEVNKRLEKLSRGYDVNKAVRNTKNGRWERISKDVKRISYKSGTWASKKLIDRLETSTLDAWSNGKVKIRENMTITQLRAVQKAISQFMASKTSTLKGIQSVKESTKASLKATLSDEDLGLLSDSEVETMYNMLSDTDFSFLSDKVGASTAWSLIEDAKDNNDTEKGWINRLNRYAFEINDLDMKAKALAIYNKYIVR